MARLVAAVLLACLAACGAPGAGGSGAGPGGTASVSGSVDGQDFTFSAENNSATLSAHEPTADLAIQLCESDCPEAVGDVGTARALTLTLHGDTGDLRIGHSYDVGLGADALVQMLTNGQDYTDPAIAGQVVVEASDLRVGGATRGTFQLQLVSGSSLRGFFDVPIVEVTGAVAGLDPQTL